jgi:hypothetical protein
MDKLMFPDPKPDDPLPNGGGFNKMMIEDDLPEMYPGSQSPLMQHATGVDVNDYESSVQHVMPMNVHDDIGFTSFGASGKIPPRGSEFGSINPHQYIMDTVYKPMGLEDAAKKRLENNPYFRPEGGDWPTHAELMVFNSDSAGHGTGGFARRPTSPDQTNAMAIAGYHPNGPFVTRHEARHVITKPEVYYEPANIDISNAIAEDGIRRMTKAKQALSDGDMPVADRMASDADMISRQQMDKLPEMITHLGDAHDLFVRTHGRMVETEADARQAMQEWAARPDHDQSVESLAKREVLMDAFSGKANDAMSRILRHMYAVPVAAGVAGSQQQQSPLQGLNQ